MKKKDLVGKNFGKLTVLKFVESRIYGGKKRRFWECICECGTVKEIDSDRLLGGAVNSCGCSSIERIKNLNFLHGETCNRKISPEYKTWTTMLSRCYSLTNKKYKIYGGRGIKVCDRWKNSFSNFLEDMGRRPDNKTSIDRIDVNKGYSPDNCRWADNYEQSHNKTTNVYFKYNGITLTMKQWADKLGFKYKWFHAQLRYKNKSLEELINESI